MGTSGGDMEHGDLGRRHGTWGPREETWSMGIPREEAWNMGTSEKTWNMGISGGGVRRGTWRPRRRGRRAVASEFLHGGADICSNASWILLYGGSRYKYRMYALICMRRASGITKWILAMFR